MFPTSVTIPPGALPGDTVISVDPSTVAPPANVGTAIGGTFEFGPVGTMFAVPVTVTLSYGALAPGFTPRNLRLATTDGGAWTVLRISLDETARTVSAQVTHFSIFGVVGMYTLSVTKSGTGSGSVTSSPLGIDCGLVCALDFAPGTTVVLSQTATVGSLFASWGGACAGSSRCAVTMNADTTVTATFDLLPAITSVTCLNLREVQAQFNQAMATTGTTSIVDISHYALSGGLFVVGARAQPGNTSVILSVGRSIGAEPNDDDVLSRDPLTYLANATPYTLTTSNVGSASFQLLSSATLSFSCADTTPPTVAAPEQPGAGTLVLTFSKPMNPDSVQAALTWDGTPVSIFANLRWQDFTDNNCGAQTAAPADPRPGCFTRLAIHSRGGPFPVGRHTLAVGGTDAAGNALAPNPTTFTVGTAPTVTGASLQVIGNLFRINVDFSESMAATQNSFALADAVNNAANYILRNPDGSAATTGGAAGSGTPITVGSFVSTDGHTANARRFRILRARIALTASGNPSVFPSGGLVPTLKPNTAYTLEVVNARSEAGVLIAPNRTTITWAGDTTPPVALRAFAAGTKLLVDYSEDLINTTSGTTSCKDEGGAAVNAVPMTNAADPTRYSSPNATFQAALATMGSCVFSDDDTGITFTFATPLAAGTYELDITGVQDPFGNLISPNPTVLTVTVR